MTKSSEGRKPKKARATRSGRAVAKPLKKSPPSKPRAVAMAEAVLGAVQLWLTTKDPYLNTEGDIFPYGGADPAQAGVKVFQGSGTDVSLPSGDYEYRFYAHNGQGDFTMHCVDPVSKQQTSPDGGPYDASKQVERNYPFQVP